MPIPRLLRLTVLLLASLLLACSSSQKGPTKLWEDLPSFSSTAAVKEQLRIVPQKDGWIETHQRNESKDNQPAYEFVRLVGPRESYRVPGELTLTFYNDRLVSTSFKASCDAYLTALVSHNSAVPEKPSAEVKLDRRTVFRYDQQETNCRFLWTDPVLEAEWTAWVRAHD